jgi:hypothetical protein
MMGIISPATLFARDYVSRVTLKDGIVATITTRDLDPSRTRFEGCTETSASCIVNGQETVASYGERPKTYLASIVVRAYGRRYNLDVSNMYEPMTGTQAQTMQTQGRNFGAYCYDSNACTFRAIFGDGGSVYAAQWEVSGPRIRRTVLTGDQSIFDWFSKNIDPDHVD